MKCVNIKVTRKRNMIDKSMSDNIKVLGVVMTAAIVMYHCGATASSNVEGGVPIVLSTGKCCPRD